MLIDTILKPKNSQCKILGFLLLNWQLKLRVQRLGTFHSSHTLFHYYNHKFSEGISTCSSHEKRTCKNLKMFRRQLLTCICFLRIRKTIQFEHNSTGIKDSIEKYLQNFKSQSKRQNYIILELEDFIYFTNFRAKPNDSCLRNLTVTSQVMATSSNTPA